MQSACLKGATTGHVGGSQDTHRRSLFQIALHLCGFTRYAERLIGSIRRECLDHLIVFSERHLRHLLLCYMKYYNETRTHLSQEKDARVSRAVDRAGHHSLSPDPGRITDMPGFNLR